jgi:hypothetical protein
MRFSSLRLAASKEPAPDAVRIEPRFVFLADLSSLLPAIAEVGVHLFLVTEVVAQGRVHLGKGDRGVLLGNGFRCGPVPEGGHESVEGYPCGANAQDTVGIRTNRHRLRSDDQ